MEGIFYFFIIANLVAYILFGEAIRSLRSFTYIFFGIAAIASIVLGIKVYKNVHITKTQKRVAVPIMTSLSFMMAWLVASAINDLAKEDLISALILLPFEIGVAYVALMICAFPIREMIDAYRDDFSTYAFLGVVIFIGMLVLAIVL